MKNTYKGQWPFLREVGGCVVDLLTCWRADDAIDLTLAVGQDAIDIGVRVALGRHGAGSIGLWYRICWYRVGDFDALDRLMCGR